MSSVRRLRKLATCEILQVAKIYNLRNLQVAKFCNPQNFDSFPLIFNRFAPKFLCFDHESSNSDQVQCVIVKLRNYEAFNLQNY